MASTKRKKTKGRGKLSFADLIRTAPGTLAGRYMRMFWQPIYRAEDLPAGKAKPIRIMSEDFTLYRGSGGSPHVVGFRCAHRGAQLSAGWVEGDCIRCMYHGWLYDSTGQCLEQPAEDKSFAKKIRIRSYPTRDYLGLIFAYLGEGEAPPFPRYPHFEKEGVLEVLPVQVWPCNFFQRTDNNGDTFHVPFVHRGAYLSTDIRSGLPTISKKESDWGTTGYATFPGGWTNVLQFIMPNGYTFRNPSPDKDIPWDDRFQWDVPLDDEHSLQFRLRLVPLTGEAARHYRQSRAAMLAGRNFLGCRCRRVGSAGQVGFRGPPQAHQRQDFTYPCPRLCFASRPGSCRRSQAGASGPVRRRDNSLSENMATRAERARQGPAAKKMGVTPGRGRRLRGRHGRCQRV